MIENVKNGEKITAKTTNDIIDACNGLLTPAEDNFTTTGKGPLFSKGAAPTSTRPTLVPDEVFQVYNGKSFEIQSRSLPYSYDVDSPQLTWFVNLPQSTTQLQTALRDISHKPILSVGVIAVDNSSLDIVLDNNQLSSTKNGWFDTASYNRQPLHLAWLYDKSSSQWHAAITDSSSKSTIGDRASQLFGSSLSCIDTCTIASISKNKQYFMPPNGISMVSADSEFDSLNHGDSASDEKHLSSLQHKVCVGKDGNGNESIVDAWNLYNFDDLENTVDKPGPNDEEELKKYDVVVRYRDEEDSGEVKYMALSSLSGDGDIPDADYPAAGLSSIQWRDVDDKTVLQLFQFDDHDRVSITETDELVIKSGARVEYASLSSLSSLLSGILSAEGQDIPPDADIPAAETSSIQTRELQNGSKVIELFKFHDPATVDVRISDLVSVDVVLRNPNNGEPYVQYGKLCIDILPDTQGESGQKSIDWLSTTHDLQLYKFDQDGLSSILSTVVTVNSNEESLIPDEYEFVVRKNGAGGEIEYVKAQLSVHAEELSGDSQVSEQKSISVENNVIQLYHMEMDGKAVSSEVPTYWDEASSILSDDYEFVVRRGGAGGEIDYTTVKLKQAQLSVDKNGHPNQKSLQYADLGDGAFLELEGFHTDGTTLPNVTVTSAYTSLLPEDNQFLIREKVDGFWQLKYAPLSVNVSSDVFVDSQVLQQQKSLEYVSGNDGDYIQLYNMDAAGEATEQVDLKNAKNGFQHLLPDDEEFVIRTAQGGRIIYKDVAVCLSAYLSGGSIISGLNVDNRSLSTDSNGDACIKGWMTDEAVSINDHKELSGYGVVARDSSKQLKYLNLSALGGSGKQYPGPFEIAIDKQNNVANFTNCVVKIARSYFFFPDQTIALTSTGDYMVYAGVDQKTPPEIHLTAYSYSWAPSYLSSANYLSCSVVPLYRVTDGEVACDFRYMMNVQAYDGGSIQTGRPWW